MSEGVVAADKLRLFIERIERLEESLHGSIVATLNNPLIDTSYRRIHNYLRLVRLERRLTAQRALHSLREHLAIEKWQVFGGYTYMNGTVQKATREKNRKTSE